MIFLLMLNKGSSDVSKPAALALAAASMPPINASGENAADKR
jgi:hypothetical protein